MFFQEINQCRLRPGGAWPW